MTESEVLAKLSIKLEEISNSDVKYNIVMFNGNQIGLEDGPKSIIMDFTDEELLENCEIDEDEVHALQQHKVAVIDWVMEHGFNVIPYG